LLNQLDVGTNNTVHLVNKLLSLAKAEPNALAQSNYSLIDLNTVASESATSLAVAAVEKNIELAFEASTGPALVNGDLSGLNDLITNLIENAIIYTPNDGRITVSITNSDTVALCVEDTGPGIPTSERERVFERFYRILGTGVSGSGLGLAIVNEIAKSHNAKVTLASGANDKGTKVTVEFSRAGKKPEEDDLTVQVPHTVARASRTKPTTEVRDLS
jgi:two-component system sensor histidine kinase TctE